MKKKVLSALLTLCMVMTLLPTAALASAPATPTVASIGTTGFTTVAEAVEAAQPNDTIKLLKDVTITSMFTLSKSITLDLNGTHLTASPATAFDITSGTLTVIDTAATKGSFVASYEAFRVHGASDAAITAKVVIGAGVKVESASDCCIYMYTGAAADVSGSLISKGTYATIQGNGSKGKGGTEIMIREGAHVESTRTSALYIPQSGKVTVSGGEIIGISSGIALKSGTLDITGGTISCTGPNTAPTEGFSNGVNASGAAIQIESNSDYAGDVVLSISDTTVVSENGSSIYEYVGKGDATAVRSITISSGSFKGGIMLSSQLVTAKKLSITGGYFTSDPSAYLADGARLTTSDDEHYSFQVTNSNAASIGTNFYKSLAAAVEAAQPNDTIKLLDDVVLTDKLLIQNGQTVNLNLNGYNIKSSTNGAINLLHGKLDISGIGTVSNDVLGSTIRVFGSTNSADQDYSVLTIGENVTLKGGYWGIGILQTKVDSEYFAYGVKVNFNGTIQNAGMALPLYGCGGITINGLVTHKDNAPIVNIGSTAKIFSDAAIYAAGYGKWTIVDGAVTSGDGGIEVKAGQVVINGGTITATGEFDHEASSNGTSTVGCAIAVVENKAYAEPTIVTINGGNFKGAIMKVDDDADTANNNDTLSITGGYFTSDPTAYLAADKAAGTSDKAGYTFMVKDVMAGVDVAVGETTTNEVPADTENKDVLDAVAVTPDAGDTGLKAAGGNEAAKVTESDKTAAATELSNAGVDTSGATVTVVVRPKLEVTPKSYDSGSKQLTLDIKAVCDTIATTDPTDIRTEDGGEKNAVKLKENQPMTVPTGTPVVIKVKIPAEMATETASGSGTYASLTIKHVKENGAVYYYDAAVSKDGQNYYATFTVTHGFSDFTLMAADARTVTVTYDSGVAQGTYSITDVGTTLPIPTKSGYTFTGWVFAGTNGVHTTLPDFWTGTTGDIDAKTATAQFSYNVPYYTLRFESNGGSSIASITKSAGIAIDLAGYLPIKEGWDFDGWYSDKELTKAATSVTLYAHTVVYAKWTEAVTNPFTDVDKDAHYYDAVLWAVKNDVTQGKTDTLFDPDGLCTRAQAVAFLWRAMGRPEPTTTVNPFTDVATDAYYYKAVLWAVEQGITFGKTATAFDPDSVVTRAEAVTFLWRAADKPTQTAANPFTDMQSGAYYEPAVLWAVSQKITEGTSTTTFSPAGNCVRAQIVTFLYRYFGK